MFLVDEDDKNSKLALMDHQVIICFQEMRVRSIVIKMLRRVLKTREYVKLNYQSLVLMHARGKKKMNA